MRVLDRLLLALVLTASCGSNELSRPTGTPNTSVTQGGAQDVGQFRTVVSGGNVPSRDLLDDVGFFNEHALDLPPADCGDPLCFHPMLAVAPRFNGANWTMAYVAMNTALTAQTLSMAPRHIVLVTEDSRRTSLSATVAAIAAALGPSLGPDDLFSWIVADPAPRVWLLARPARELGQLMVEGGGYATDADLFGALTLAYEVAAARPLAARDQQILLFTSGHTGGIQELAAFEGLADRFAEAGVVVSAFGMGDAYRREIPRALTDITAGNHYFVTGPADLHDALLVAGKTGFLPLARQLRLEVTASPGYRIGAIYGASRARRTTNTAVVQAPALYIGARAGATDVGSGRRGGGGGVFVELLADSEPGRAPLGEAPAFSLSASYLASPSGVLTTRTFTLGTPFGVGNNPQPNAPFFSDSGRAKPFMMLNMYLALLTATTLYQSQDCGAALGIEDMMRMSYRLWNELYTDPDIDGDYALLGQLTSVMRKRCTAPVARPVEVPMSCFFL
jgi:Ca-activated chloride channel family protein